MQWSALRAQRSASLTLGVEMDLFRIWDLELRISGQ